MPPRNPRYLPPRPLLNLTHCHICKSHIPPDTKHCTPCKQRIIKLNQSLNTLKNNENNTQPISHDTSTELNHAIHSSDTTAKGI